MADADHVIAVCEAEWERHKSDCSGFAKAVGQRLEVQLTGLANDIVDQISAPPWSPLEDGIAACREAAAGELVIRALKGAHQSAPTAHSHPAVVVKPQPLPH